MKELLLKDCVGVNNLVIESSSLESIWYESHAYNDKRHVNISCDRLEKLHFNAPIGGKTDRLVNISAPNLKYLEWFGEFMTRLNLGNLMCLEKAETSSSFMTCNFDGLFDFLCSIRKVKVLILHPDIVERLWLNCDYWKSKEISFISQAKEVVIQYQCRSYVIEFAYYILGHAHD
ncbi:hypothetical protein DVH24_021904 [Malus domestica]|uniref:FBD domain-containing protein n=1 Tax=Malus domestica TaxID=3750 RepID=A0A498IZ94_MALDO|nr:hypothetical protein DVH24_021904 [Malus domestica]